MATNTAESGKAGGRPESEVDVGFRSERGPILISLMLGTSLVALDSTIIATSVLSIVDDLGGFSQFPWLFSIYLLAQAVSVPIYGKIADIFGRKPVMLFGIGLFAVGSILCGFAWSMPALIVFRAIQGLGAGAVQPMSITIAGDIYTVKERAKAQGYLASVWAISSVLGPTLGGVFSEYLTWRWIFFVNVPLCALAAWMLMRNFREKTDRRHTAIDYPGAAALTIGAAAIILGLLEGGNSWEWWSPIGVGIFVLGIASLALFTWIESRTDHPILPLWVLTRRLLIVSSALSLLIGALVLGLTTYVPTYVQGVLGTGAIVAGFALATLTLGWPIAASQSGKIYLRFGFRATALVGGVFTVLGAGSAVLISQDAQVWQVAAVCFVTGIGLGLVASPTLIAAQSSVDWSERGVVTSTNLFARSIGSAVGVAIFGAVVNSRVGTSGNPPPAQLADAIHLVFLGVAGAAVAMLVLAFFLPGRKTSVS